MQTKALIGIVGVFLVIIGAMYGFQDKVADLNRTNLARREVSYICRELSEERVKEDELCSTPLMKISALGPHYRQVQSVDGEWFKSKGWSYYPAVECSETGVTFTYMDKHLRCSDAKAELIETDERSGAIPGVAYAENPNEAVEKKGIDEPPAKPCYETTDRGRLRTVIDVQSNGTIVLDGNDRVLLLGVEIPAGETGGENSTPCIDEAVRYLRARLVTMGVYIFQEKGVGRDEMYRLPCYVVSSSGELLNRELVRVGLAKGVEQQPGGNQLSCGQDLDDVEQAARERTLGLWATDCLSGLLDPEVEEEDEKEKKKKRRKYRLLKF